MKLHIFKSNSFFFTVTVLLLLLSGCGSAGNNASPPAATGTQFWSVDFTHIPPTVYSLQATKKAEGTHCYIYVENGQTVTPAAINAIMNAFDTVIYPGDTTNFGSEPKPGADGDEKIYLLLSKFRESGSTSYIAGFFDPSNEYPTSSYSYSNQKELFFMNIDPAPAKGIVPGNTQFLSVLAHEFQHMIHWNQKTNRVREDDTWLNEAMSEIAPVYCGFGPNTDRIAAFQADPSHSLTDWSGDLAAYNPVYMWAQYFKDRFTVTPNIFKTMLSNNFIGIDSVNNALATAISSSTTFTSTFRDWSIAVASGTTTTWLGHPEWSMVSVDTPDLLFSLNLNSLPTMSAWSMGFYAYTTLLSTGTVTWTAAVHEQASFIAYDNTSVPPFTIEPNMISNTSYTFTTAGFLITQNTSTFSTSGDTVTHTAPSLAAGAITLSPRAMLKNADKQTSLKPRNICVQSYFANREQELRKLGAKPAF